jgi:precorrin-6Y C5,15-methyltransferase (decarboxylating)
MTIYLVGAGPGDLQLLTDQAREAIAKANIVIGAKRLLDSTTELIGQKPRFALIKASEIVAQIEDLNANSGTDGGIDGNSDIAVILSGDPGFYSGAKKLITAFKQRNWQYQVVNGISSLTYFAGCLGLGWDEMAVVSLHGRTADVVSSVQANDKVFFLTDSVMTAAVISQTLVDAGLPDYRVNVGERLSYPDQRITSGTAAELASLTFDTLTVVIIEKPNVAEGEK